MCGSNVDANDRLPCLMLEAGLEELIAGHVEQSESTGGGGNGSGAMINTMPPATAQRIGQEDRPGGRRLHAGQPPAGRAVRAGGPLGRAKAARSGRAARRGAALARGGCGDVTPGRDRRCRDKLGLMTGVYRVQGTE